MKIKPKRLYNRNNNVFNKKVERKQRIIDLSKYNIGFDSVSTPKKKGEPFRSTNKATQSYYDKYLVKLDKHQLNKFSTRDIMFFFRDTANENGVKYIIANPQVDMRNFKLAIQRGYTIEEILVMIEFLFTSGQTYLDIHSIHPGILLTNWCNTIYKDSQLWLKDEFDPDAKNRKHSNKPTREWTNDNKTKTKIGWDD